MSCANGVCSIVVVSRSPREHNLHIKKERAKVNPHSFCAQSTNPGNGLRECDSLFSLFFLVFVWHSIVFLCLHPSTTTAAAASRSRKKRSCRCAEDAWNGMRARNENRLKRASKSKTNISSSHSTTMAKKMERPRWFAFKIGERRN